MSRSPVLLVVVVFALGLLAVPAAFAKHGHQRAVRIQGICTKQSTSKLNLKREDRRLEVEFEVDQNRNDVPWTVILSRNGATVTSFTATTRAPSGSFEIRRIIAGRLRTDRVTVVATQTASGETCTADSSAVPTAAVSTTTTVNVTDDDNGHDNDDGGDDHGGDSGSHS